MTRADSVSIDFHAFGQGYTLDIDLAKQDAQKSHGLCRGGPDVANLPRRERTATTSPRAPRGSSRLKYEDGTIGLMEVTAAISASRARASLSGSQGTIDEHNEKLQSDPVTGELGELGFGTQELPVSGRDIQDEKILGTLHVATGRSDHLGGHLTPEMFANKKNATHDDILFSPEKTPEIVVTQARMKKDGETKILIENFEPKYMRELLDA